MARLSFKRQPLYVGVDDKQEAATREGLEQGYCIVPSEQRLLLLFTFLKKNKDKKVSSRSDKVQNLLGKAALVVLLMKSYMHFEHSGMHVGDMNGKCADCEVLGCGFR